MGRLGLLVHGNTFNNFGQPMDFNTPPQFSTISDNFSDNTTVATIVLQGNAIGTQVQGNTSNSGVPILGGSFTNLQTVGNSSASGTYPDTLSIGANISGSPIPVVGTPTVGQAACIKAAGPPVLIGFCSTVVGSTGACTCN